ncbi:hypothetical protein JYT29_01400 [Nitrospina gracilis]|nr:hypothetical protein [Nitrospina gracilis]
MIPDGPTIIYDKSTLQSLTSQEANWLHHHFHAVLTPTLFCEVLGDLKKEFKRGKTPEEEVAILAKKIPSYAITPNMPYHELVLGDLIYEKIELRGKPYLGRGKRIENPDGSYAMYYDQSPEEKALQHWIEGDFNAMERERATHWRESISNLDLSSIKKNFKPLEEGLKNFKTFEEILWFVDTILNNNPEMVLMSALHYLKVPANRHAHIYARWSNIGRPPFTSFAPYAAHVLRVDLFFMSLISRNLISDQRPSHLIDFHYFYYLPFTKIFTSNDKLHKQIAPLLLTKNQRFVDQSSLKKDLGSLVEYYENLPEEIKKTGSMNYASYPPREGDFLVSKLYDQLYPKWREYADIKPEPRDPQRDKETMKRFRHIFDAIEKDKASK